MDHLSVDQFVEFFRQEFNIILNDEEQELYFRQYINMIVANKDHDQAILDVNENYMRRNQ